MDLISALLLGILQGIFEWFPISSQGQIMGLAIGLFNISPSEALKLSVFLHIGTLISATIYFRSEIKTIIVNIFDLFKNGFKETKENELTKFLVISFFSTAITAIPAYLLLKWFISSFSPFLFLILLGILLFVMGYIQQKLKNKKHEGILSNINALILGLAQGFSVLPGISRSGMTTSILLIRNFSPEKAFKISFLLSVPSVLVAELLFSIFDPISIGLAEIVAVISAAIIGYITIQGLLIFAKKINFSLFCYGFGLLYFVLALLSFL